MNALRRTFAICLLAIIIPSAGFLGACSKSMDFEAPTSTPRAAETTSPEAETAPLTQSPPSERTSWIEVVYFHRAQRCGGCVYAEDATRYTMETYFASELANGSLVFNAFNLQDEANAEIVEKYRAYSSSLFISEIKDGTESIEEVTDIWTKLGRDEEFIEVVKTALEQHLGGI